jgi:hypothetical protein
MSKVEFMVLAKEDRSENEHKVIITCTNDVAQGIIDNTRIAFKKEMETATIGKNLHHTVIVFLTTDVEKLQDIMYKMHKHKLSKMGLGDISNN